MEPIWREQMVVVEWTNEPCVGKTQAIPTMTIIKLLRSRKMLCPKVRREEEVVMWPEVKAVRREEVRRPLTKRMKYLSTEVVLLVCHGDYIKSTAVPEQQLLRCGYLGGCCHMRLEGTSPKRKNTGKNYLVLLKVCYSLHMLRIQCSQYHV